MTLLSTWAPMAAMGIVDLSAWGIIVGLALMLAGGLVLWAYTAHRDKTAALSLTVSGPEAAATRLFHTHLVHWFFIYGWGIIAAGVIVLALARFSL